MKKILLAALILAGINANAQTKGYKVGWNGVYDQVPVVEEVKSSADKFKYVYGSRFYPTTKNSSIQKRDDLKFEFGLRISAVKGCLGEFDLVLRIAAVDKYVDVYKGSPLLIKLNDGEVIKLSSNSDEADHIGRTDTMMGYLYTVYSIYPSYNITRSQIESLQKGISKIRIECSSEKWDIEFRKYKEEELGDFLFKEAQLIEDAFDNEKEFDDDF